MLSIKLDHFIPDKNHTLIAEKLVTPKVVTRPFADE